jgi:hypothetical protein
MRCGGGVNPTASGARYHLAASRQLTNDATIFSCTFGLTKSQIEQIEVRRMAERPALLKASRSHRGCTRSMSVLAIAPGYPSVPIRRPRREVIQFS